MRLLEHLDLPELQRMTWAAVVPTVGNHRVQDPLGLCKPSVGVTCFTSLAPGLQASSLGSFVLESELSSERSAERVTREKCLVFLMLSTGENSQRKELSALPVV